MTDELSITVRGQRLSGWTELQLTRGIESFPSFFEIGLTEKYPGAFQDVVIQPGDPCTVQLGADVALTGYVDRYAARLDAHAHAIHISGRSRCEDLVDCSADIQPGQNQITNATVLQISQAMTARYGINVKIVGAGEDTPIRWVMVNLGESPATIIERVARYAAFLVYDDPQGNLVLSRAGTASMASGFEQGVNVLAAAADFSMDQRMAEYRVVWQSVWAYQSDQPLTAIQGVAKDPAVAAIGRGNRLLYVVSEQGVDGQNFAQLRADWERNRRAGRAQAITIVADSWRDTAGALWEPNRLANVDVPLLKVSKQNWLISEVSYRRDLQSGTTAQLTLMPPEALGVEPINLAIGPWDAFPGQQANPVIPSEGPQP